MDRSSLAARVREALQQSAGGRRLHEGWEGVEDRRARMDAEQAAWMADVLGGWWHRTEDGLCLVIDRDYRPDVRHGEADLGAYAETLERYGASLAQSRPLADDHAALEFVGLPLPDGAIEPAGGGRAESSIRPAGGETERLLFFDLETTGLSGGAGTCVFLIGCGWFEGSHFRTRQYFLTGYAYEEALLRRAAEIALAGSSPALTVIAGDGTLCAETLRLVTFNGKTFDVPLIEGRYLFHRLASPFSDLPHLDLLHHARRLWRYRPDRARQQRNDRFESYSRASERRDGFRGSGGRAALSPAAASCALGELEGAILGFQRTGDVPGAEIPSRYFQYVRTGDVRPLEPVLAHNRFDLVSLAALTAVVARMVEEGPSAAANPHECLALGRLYERSGKRERAAACYKRAGAVEAASDGWTPDLFVQREALRRLAQACRRAHRHDEAAEAWERIIALPAAGTDHEALEALAVHHEHRSRDLAAARAYAVRALSVSRDPRVREAAQYRLARIDRKLEGSGVRTRDSGPGNRGPRRQTPDS